MTAAHRHPSRVPCVALMVAAAAALAAGSAAAQIPQEYTNLEILPSDITRAELVPIMRGFASALGVRCSHCHMVSDQLNQPDDDFASDDKAAKRKARTMIRMVASINEQTLAGLPDRGSPAVEVTCNTCHGGITRPVPIATEIEYVIEQEGVEAAVAHYRALRESFYGSRAYDFTFRALNDLGERLVGQDRTAEAVAVLELNAEYNAESLPTLLLLGQAHEANADNASALEVYRQLVDLDPATPFYDFYAGRARARIEAIGGMF